MADREYFVGGVQVFETEDLREYFVNGVQINESLEGAPPEPPAGARLLIIRQLIGA